MLTDEEVERFHRDGYMKFRRVLEEEQLRTLRDAYERTVRAERERTERGDLPPEFLYGHDRGDRTLQRRAIHQFVNMWKVVPEFRALLDHPEITGAVRELMDVPAVRLWHDQIISKPPGDNDKFNCHHDFYFWPLDRPRMITCWLALDDATVDNGCMHVVPGSHRDPRFQPPGCDLSPDIHLSPAPMGPGEPGSLYDAVRQYDVDQTRPVELQAGECMFHHCLNYHFTPRNRTDRPRRAFVMIFMPDGTRYRHAQSPNHVCTNYLGLEDGAVLNGPGFPICGAGT